ncbi:hypothetical protein [Pedobacter steynii]
MKRLSRTGERIKAAKEVTEKTGLEYYFHADEDFREDWDWGKSKLVTSRTLFKPGSKFEI